MTDMYVAPKQLKAPELPPEASQLGAVVWVRRNLFNSPFNTILTVVLVLMFFFAARGFLGWAFDPARMWGVIPNNATNYAVEGYPRPELTRVWVSLDILAALIGLSAGVWRPKSGTSVARVVAGFRALGTTVAILAALAPSTFGGRVMVLVAGLLVLAAALVVGRMLTPSMAEQRISTPRLTLALLVVFLAVVWVLPIATSTAVPLTIAAAVGVGGFVVARLIVSRVDVRKVKPALVALWVVVIPANWLHVQRHPVFPWDTVTGEWLPWLVAFAVGGVLLIGVVSRASREAAGLINAVLVVGSVAVWLFSVPMVARALLAVLTGVSLATPTFGSGERGRRNLTLAWLGLAAFVTYLFVLGVATTGLNTRNAYFGGFNLTVMLAAGAILLSAPLGLALALGRTSSMPLFRLMSTGYIEVVRGVPLITLLFFFRFGVLNFIPVGEQIDAIVLILVAMTMFSAAYLAENVRGGLQSIPKGQYEAARALGMTTAQMTMLITLPQALRAVIPALVGQVIALFKDTSLVAIVGMADFFRVVRDVVPNQPTSLGSIFENLLFGAAVYWIFTFNFSRASQRLERRLGVGTR